MKSPARHRSTHLFSRVTSCALLAMLAFAPAARSAEKSDEMDSTTASMLEADTLPPRDANAKPSAATTPITLRIDWGKTRFRTAREAYSLNAFRNFGAEVPSDPTYQKNIVYINPGMLRYHNTGLIDDSVKSGKSWVNHTTRAWDAERIKTVTANWPKGPAIQITIPKWPAYLSSSPENLLDEQNYAAYAKLCADLVRIVNIDLKLGVKRWEPMNEREMSYVRALEKNGKKPQYSKLIEIYNRCAIAMKTVDPTIQVGGPAVSSAAWLEVINSFVKGAGKNLDFFSCHLYAGNKASASDEQIFDAAVNMGPRIARVAEVLKREIPGRQIDISLNEFNINYTYKTADHRMENHKGAVFDALVMISVLSNDCTSTCAWNDADSIYGKMTRQYQLRPSAHLYHLLNAHFVGEVAATTSTDEKRVLPFAVRDARSGERSILLVNRSGAPQTVKIAGEGAAMAAALARHEISAAGYTTVPFDAKTLATGVTLPDCSVTVLAPAMPDPSNP